MFGIGIGWLRGEGELSLFGISLGCLRDTGD